MERTKSDKIDIIGSNSNCEDKSIERWPSKNLDGAVEYLTLKAKLAFI